MLKTDLSDQKIFQDFCKLNANRIFIITSILDKENIPYTKIKLDNAEHLLLFPHNLITGNEATVLLAHYDRVNGTPGANDNSASIFYLLYHAKRLKNINHSTIIIFTDKEEIGLGDSVTDQGSYGLGKYFKSKKIDHLRFFVFDMCGIGTTLLLGTGGESLIKNHYGVNYISSNIKKKIEIVKKDAEETLLTINGGEFFYLTPLFSDDLGLILNEYPAVLISLLPYREAVEYRKNPSTLPKSWSCNHTLNDSINTLDSKSWSVLSPLLSRLSGIKENRNENENKDLYFKCYTQKIDSLYLCHGGIKNPLDYIKKESFSITNIKTDCIDNLHKYLLFSSTIKSGAAAYFSSLLSKKSEDLSYDIYYLLKQFLDSEYKELPDSIKIKNKKILVEKESSLLDYLYNNIMLHIKNDFCINSTPINKKIDIKIDISNSVKDEYLIKFTSGNDYIGTIKIIKDKHGFILKNGNFIPNKFLRLDPLNLLKGIRLVLIKWVKLNNNNSLRINLTRSNWIGCDQFYRLLEMEMEGKTSNPESSDLIYVWKRYNG